MADAFSEGAKRRIFGWSSLPKWAPAKSNAVDIYGQLLRQAPTHEVAVASLFAKGKAHFKSREYRESIDAYKEVIQRFPMHERTGDAFVEVARIYQVQSTNEHANPDLLALAEVNMKNFQEALPRDPRLETVQVLYSEMEENYASGLYEVGRFYERKKKPGASKLYYQKAIRMYPNTQVSDRCKERLSHLGEAA